MFGLPGPDMTLRVMLSATRPSNQRTVASPRSLETGRAMLCFSSWQAKDTVSSCTDASSMPEKTFCQGSRDSTLSGRTQAGSRRPDETANVLQASARTCCAEASDLASNTSVPLAWKLDAEAPPFSRNARSSCALLGEPARPRLVFLKNATNCTMLDWHA